MAQTNLTPAEAWELFVVNLEQEDHVNGLASHDELLEYAGGASVLVEYDITPDDLADLLQRYLSED